MLLTSDSPNNTPPATVNGVGNGFAHSEREGTAVLKEAPKTATAHIVPLPEPVVPPVTQHGPDVLAIYARAYDWAIGERHGLLTLDHLLFALADRQIGASALLAAGVTDVGDLEIELLNLVHKSAVKALVDGARPAVDNAVLAAFNHALGYAHQHGRQASNVTDLLAALLDVLRMGKPDTPGLTALRRRWSRATDVDDVRQVLAKILEFQTNQPAMLAKALVAELTAIRDRIATIERRTFEAPPTPRLPWYRRLNILLLSLCILALVSIGAGLWPFAA